MFCVDRRVRPLGAALVVLGLMGSGPPTLAQERPGSVYFLAGVVLTDQAGPTGEVHETYVTAPGGTTSGWLVGGGVALARRLSIEAEWSRTGIMTAREPSRYNTTFNEERRDRFATVALRFSFPLSAAVRLEPVAGLVLTSPQAWSQSEQCTHTPQRRSRRSWWSPGWNIASAPGSVPRWAVTCAWEAGILRWCRRFVRPIPVCRMVRTEARRTAAISGHFIRADIRNGR